MLDCVVDRCLTVRVDDVMLSTSIHQLLGHRQVAFTNTVENSCLAISVDMVDSSALLQENLHDCLVTLPHSVEQR